MSSHRQDSIIYSGDRIPVGGEFADVLMKAAGPNYYTKWESLGRILSEYDIIIDEGEY